MQPVGQISSPPLELRWDDSGSRDAIWYQVIIHWGNKPYWSKWMKVEETIDYGGARATTNLPAFTAPFGTYKWWIRAWNKSGMGPWSASETFTVTP